ncbi:hypothetical protein GCM10010172_06530 [Paractinoplanes ferrugineus]|uniref:Uncharacterized protein n=1 Tax=Paractinoplanes ferrugineus TaxID=113564 RepID=A0A919JA47_9ACTN|nr:hypothetical protein [Actinoplanes ferrugineus]GIE16319.1 hypothetical protein Afe05nite_81590 [Actinoplanes ferrugineus]
MVETREQPGHCINGTTCKAADPATRQGYPTSDPYCWTCLQDAERDIRGLVYDYLDLAQLQEPAMSQAINEKTRGSKEPPMPLAAQVDELQAEIVHAVSLWEHALRAVTHLHNPHTFAPLWRTTVYDHLNLTTGRVGLLKARGGATVQRAVGVIAPRLERLANLPAATVCPTGIESEPVPMCGWEAVQQLQNLHRRARAALGRTTRKFWIGGNCWTCHARQTAGEDGPLWRSEPKRPEDPMEVRCSACGAARPYPDYEAFMTTLEWPELEVAA